MAKPPDLVYLESLMNLIAISTLPVIMQKHWAVGPMARQILNKILHRNRAPQNLYKLMQYYQIPKPIITKLVRFHIDNRKIANHKPRSGDGKELEQMHNNERLVAMLSGDRKKSEELGYSTRLVPWSDEFVDYHGKTTPTFYVYKDENADIVDAMMNVKGPPLDLLHGLAFGYAMVDVFNLIRKKDQQLVDKICGNVDQFNR